MYCCILSWFVSQTLAYPRWFCIFSFLSFVFFLHQLNFVLTGYFLFWPSVLPRFGLVSKRNASAIVDKCVLGTEGMKANWRGNMANPGTKAEPVETPKPTSTVTAADASRSPVPPTVMPKKELEPSGSTAVNGGIGRPRHESIDGA